MATFLEHAYSVVHQDNTADQPTLQELRTQLEKGNDEQKLDTMKRILTIMLNGDAMPQLLMHIIRFVMPSKSKPLKKLLYFYYEICPKLDAGDKLKQEMILVCNGIRNDLQHPNEYIRGNTLRFLCKLRESELIEPLLTPARSCLEHRHAYVRKNAVLAVSSIYHHSESLIPDAPDLIQAFLETESDHTCKRNAFAALSAMSHEKALEYLSGALDGIPNADELLQLVELEFIRKDAVQNAQNKAKYLRLIFDLLEAGATTVVYEAASSLTSLTNNPVAVKAAATKFIELSIKEADNNVKLIVLDRVDQLRQRNEGVLDDLTMEILRVLSSPDIDVRKKALNLALEMVSSRNVEEVVMLLKKELSKTLDEQYEKNNEYRQLLIHSIHQCAIKFSEVAASVVELLMDFIADFNATSAVDVISFVKEVVEKFPQLRPTIVERLVSTLSEVRAGKVYRGALWIVGEYSLEANDIREAWKRIRASLGEIPILSSEQRLLDEVPEDSKDASKEQINGHAKPSAPTGSRKVLADGTYATESALTSQSSAAAKLEAVKAAQKPPLRQLILDGDFYLASVLSSTLTKLVMRHAEISEDSKRTNALRAEAMLIMISIIRVGQSQFVKAPIDEDSVDRIMSCVRSLAEFARKKDLETVFLNDTRKAFRAMVQVEEKKRAAKEADEKAKSAVQVDDVVSIRQLAKKGAGDGSDAFDMDLEKATGGDSASEDLASKLSRVVQLTGFSDPVYAEAYVQVHQFDIVLDVLLVNQTAETLQNLSVEFATLGDLKVVERPTTQNLGARDFQNVQSTIKVSSTDTGVIFGNVVYDGSSSTESNVVILNDVHVNIMDYIQPAHCTETQFRTMWTEFEWENKVNINSKAKSLREFLSQLMACTNMTCLTPEASMKGDCQFLSANLYARSVFGEDALANLSIEKEGPGSESWLIERLEQSGRFYVIVVQGVVFLKSNEHCRPHGHHQKVGGEEAGVAHHEEESRLASQAEVRQSGQKWTAKQEQGKKADAAVLGQNLHLVDLNGDLVVSSYLDPYPYPYPCPCPYPYPYPWSYPYCALHDPSPLNTNNPELCQGIRVGPRNVNPPQHVGTADPFIDPIEQVVGDEALEDSVLAVGRDASLTLATDTLIVLDENLTRRKTLNCCGLIPSSRKTTQAIPFFNVLWAELSDFELTVTYARPTSKNAVRVASIHHLVEKAERGKITAWISKLLDRAYGESQRRKRIKVLINPFGGKGSAQKWFLRDIEPIFAAARCEVDIERTAYRGHAVEIAAKLDPDAYDVIASCSGDGLPHEVFNGLGKKKDARRALSQVAVVQLPCGSGNAMSWNLNGTDSTSVASLCIVKGIRTPLDLVSITQGDKRTLSFLSQAVGVVAEVDLGTENIRWMGSARFTYGFLVRLLGKTVYPADIAVKVEIPTKASIREHYRKELSNRSDFNSRRDSSIVGDNSLPALRYGSVQDPLPSDWSLVPHDKLGNFYSGNMAFMAPNANFFPAALPNDGYADLVTVDGDISRSAAIKSLTAVENGSFFDMVHVNYRKISGYRIIPRGQRSGYISIDGERVPFEPFQAEVHRGLGTVLSRSGHLYEAKGVAISTGD